MKIFLPLLLAGMPAFTHTITYDHSLPNLFHNVEVKVNGNVLNVSAGQIGVQIDGIFPALMYCADPLTWLRLGPTDVSPVIDTVFANGARMAWLYNTYNPILTQGWEAAALQIAIWEVVLDNNDDSLHSGLMQITGNTNAQAYALAGSMLYASAGQSSTGINFWVPNRGPSYSQTLLSAAPAPLTETPEPSYRLLLGAGLLLIGFLRRR
ncbi:MAG: hypothetical protein ACKV2U_11370 [Bryobacteraceae bacterium]